MIKTILAALLFGLTLTAANLHAADDSGKIVVMPIQFADESLSEGAEVLQEVISDYFKDNNSVQIISEEQQEALAGDDTGGSRAQLIRTVTEKMAGNHALIVSLRGFRERVGDEYSVEDPASLAFEFELIKIANGETVCRGRFDETQQTLTENILNFFKAFKRGFKWITVREMAVEAIREKLSTCPTLQEKSYIGKTKRSSRRSSQPWPTSSRIIS